MRRCPPKKRIVVQIVSVFFFILLIMLAVYGTDAIANWPQGPVWLTLGEPPVHRCHCRVCERIQRKGCVTMQDYKLDTLCIHGGYSPKNGEPRVAPIVQSTTYVYESSKEMGALFDLQEEGFFYTRLGNPTTTWWKRRSLPWKAA